MSDELQNVLTTLRTGITQASANQAKSQTEMYKNGSWKNFLPMVVSAVSTGVPSSNCYSYFNAAKSAIALQSLMYDKSMKEGFVQIDLYDYKEKIDIFVKEREGICVCSEDEKFLYTFRHGVMLLTSQGSTWVANDDSLIKELSKFGNFMFGSEDCPNE